MNKLTLVFVTALVAMAWREAFADGACWIAYPGDHAIEQGNRLMARRNNHGRLEPSPWAAYAAWPTVVFESEADLLEDETVEVFAQGVYYMRSRGRPGDEDGTWVFPKGKYTFSVRVFNPGGVPALFIRGKHLQTDATWKANAWNEEHLPVEAFPACDTPEWRPCDFRLSRERHEPKSVSDLGSGHTLVDFGEETYGYLKLSGLKGKGRMVAIFGEWEDEAKDHNLANAENYERFDVDASKAREIELMPRGFRYVHLYALKGDPAVGGVSLDYEYLPLETKGAFRCSDERLNRIWDVSVRTLHLTAREAFLDGIKRDHWIWSGDARQSFLMNYYSFADNDICRRTLWALRGHDPYAMHMNWIMDYTFYWFLSVEEYYLFTGDRTFLEQIYPRMKSAMAFVIGRLDANGFIVNRGDWVFVDWSPKKMNNGSKESPGAVSFEQMLFVKALEATANVAKALGRDDEAEPYAKRAAETKAKIMPKFWDEERGAIYHYLEPDGKTLDKTGRFEALTRYPNMFGLTWGYFTPEQAKRVIDGVIFNDEVMKIQTPYMQFYEMEALLKLGRHDDVLKGIRSYWGGMLDLGATSFWELYNPEEKGAAHMAMYGRPYGRSACHAWGASPVYLLGRYYLGVEPTSPGFATYTVKPVLGGLDWMEGKVPTPVGPVSVSVKGNVVTVVGCGGEGTLQWNGKQHRIPPMGTVTIDSKGETR